MTFAEFLIESHFAGRDGVLRQMYEDKIAALAAQAPQAATPVWLLIDPDGNVVARETTCIKAWARINGYKPTVEGLLGYEEKGWRVVAPQAPAAQPLTWQPMETAPKDEKAWFWLVPKTAEEAWLNTDGEPVLAKGQSYMEVCKFRCWSSLYKATHWMPLPSPPLGIAPPAQGEPKTGRCEHKGMRQGSIETDGSATSTCCLCGEILMRRGATK